METKELPRGGMGLSVTLPVGEPSNMQTSDTTNSKETNESDAGSRRIVDSWSATNDRNKRSLPHNLDNLGSSRRSVESLELPQKGNPKDSNDGKKLRKGKWTVEEEEYTSRIIYYFSIGLLTLPEGATLRSYLGEKLNCDPMRITKKYAGAACLGRRAFHYRDRPQPTIGDIQLAKAELDHLEQRFRTRIEDGYSDMPISPPPSMLFAMPSQPTIPEQRPVAVMTPPSQNAVSPDILQAWLLGLQAGAAMPAAALQGVGSSHTPPNLIHGMPGINSVWNISMPSQPAQWPFAASPATPTLQSQDISQIMAQLMFSQAAAASVAAPVSLPVSECNTIQSTPSASVSQSTVKVQAVSSSQSTVNAPSDSPHPSPVNGHAKNAVDQLRQAYEKHLGSQLNPARVEADDPITPAFTACGEDTKPKDEASKDQTPKESPAPKLRSDDDKADGSILFGFLNSLRKSYEQALREKQVLEGQQDVRRIVTKEQRPMVSMSSAGIQRKRPAVVTDSSSSNQDSTSSNQEPEDSDWISDKKTDPSSSEDSDKEVAVHLNKGPPRKRMKAKSTPIP